MDSWKPIELKVSSDVNTERTEKTDKVLHQFDWFLGPSFTLYFAFRAFYCLN